MPRMATLDVAGGPMPLHVSEFAREGPAPAVVVMHHRPGIDAFTVDRCDRLAAEGILAVAPDLYHRQAVGVPTQEAKDHLKDDEIAADIGAALAFLEADPRVDPARIGIIGHCQGGRTALVGLVTHPAFRAGVLYYGGRAFKALGGDGVAPADKVANIRCPVAGFFGNLDGNPSPEDVDRLSAIMDKAGVKHVFHRYDGAGHGFQDHTAPKRYHESSAKDAWARTLDFLRRELAP